MPSEKRDNSGALFRNEDQSKSEYSGSCLVNGQEFWINAWVKEGKRGKFFSLSFRPKQAPADPPRQQSWKEELDDDIPF